MLCVGESSSNSSSLGHISVASLCASQRVTCSDNSRLWTLDRTVKRLHRWNLQITTCWTHGSISDGPATTGQKPVWRPVRGMSLLGVWAGHWTDPASQIASVHLSLPATAPNFYFLMHQQGETHRKNVTRNPCYQIRSNLVIKIINSLPGSVVMVMPCFSC